MGLFAIFPDENNIGKNSLASKAFSSEYFLRSGLQDRGCEHAQLSCSGAGSHGGSCSSRDVPNVTGQDQGRRGPGGGAGCPRAGQEGPQASPGAAAETPFSQESHVRSLRYACGPGLCWASPEASPVAQGRRETLIRFLLGRSPGGGNGNPTAWSGAQGSLADRWRPPLSV